MNITFTKEALDVLTPEQLGAVRRLTHGHKDSVSQYSFMRGGFDLPSGYISFRQDWNNSNESIYGGISPNGDVST